MSWEHLIWVQIPESRFVNKNYKYTYKKIPKAKKR